jgi:hypothetical protein
MALAHGRHPVHHWVRLADVDLDLILTFDPEDLVDAERDPHALIREYRKWAETVREAVDDGLETW